MPSLDYSSVSTKDADESASFIEQKHGLDQHECCCQTAAHRRTRARRCASVLFWGLIIFFQGLSLYGLFTQRSCPNYFTTDLKDSWGSIHYEQRRNTGQLAWDDDKKVIYLVTPPDQPLYFGEPSESIDQAWEEVARGKFLYLNDEELAQYMTTSLLKFDDGRYYFTPEMFHSLHCLNVVRMKLDEDYYQLHPTRHRHGNMTQFLHQDNWERIHIDHCLDQIRQSIQCTGDLSPVLVHEFGGIPVGFGVGEMHTCRKWAPIKEWMFARNELEHTLKEQW